MTRQKYILIFILLLIGQMFICNYLNFNVFITISLLPALIICLPLRNGTIAALLIAFVSGLGVDFFSDAVLGLNAFALLPVALIRIPVIRAFLGDEIIERQGHFSIRANGLGKISSILLIAIAVFSLFYIVMDGAWLRPFWFNISRLGISVLCSYLLGILVVSIFTPRKE